MKGYTVFNVEQIEGLPAHYHAPAAPVLDPIERIESSEAYFGAIRADTWTLSTQETENQAS